MSEQEPGAILVGFRAGVDDVAKDASEVRHGSSLGQRLAGINVDLVRLPSGKDMARAIRDFEADPTVAFAEPNFVARADTPPPPNDPLYAGQYGPQKLNASEAHNVVYPGGYPVYGGGNPTSPTHPLIAVLDTGIAAGASDPAANADLVHKVAAVGADCTLTAPSTTAPCPTSAPYDDYGHGTHVAGIAAAETNNGVGIVGIAPGAQLVSIKVLDSNGSGYYSWIASGVLCAANLASCGLGSGHADVINLSLGGSSASSTLASAIATAQRAGVVVVASAGNSNTTSLSYPAAYADLSVIATDSADQRAYFSNYGGNANQVSAPGVNILSTVSTDPDIQISDPSGYAQLSGTSMAAPHVTGVSALLAGRGLARSAIVDRIKQTADPLPTATAPDKLHYGAGRVNAYRAVANAAPTPDFALSVSPASSTVARGSPTSYTVTITRTGGFTGAVTLGVAGLPAGATATFNPNATTANSSTLTVTTSSTTPTGTFTLTVSGTGTGLTGTRTASVTLVVTAPATPDFALSVSPASSTVGRGSPTSYTVTITRTGGFTGAVTLGVAGLPAGATATFNPNATTANSSTLTVTTSSTTPTGTFTLTVSGTGAGLTGTRTASVTLVVTAAAPACDGECP